MVDIHAFTYRAARLHVELPVEFEVDGHTIQGWTRELNENGMLVALAEPLLVKTKGKVRLRFGACQCEIEAAVAHSEIVEAGLAFCFGSEAEREFVKTLVRLLSRRIQTS